jgi:tetratricopeptide (TPR) repeat protein
LLKGKKYLDRGNFTAAAEEFKAATSLLATNANAWNYYGVALQGGGQLDEAANAYQRALDLNRDLSEAHFNLGNLRLQQNNAEAAKAEFTAYTLRRNNDPAGWLKLGSAQLQLGEIVVAEKSFSTVLALKSNDAEAYNGLGLARIQRGRPGDAAKFFAAAKEQRPDFAPAILNLATVEQEYLHDNKAALENYLAYLALKPRAANWDEVNALANSLQFTPAPVAVLPPSTPAPTPTVNTPAPAPKPQPRVVSVPTPRPPSVVKTSPPTSVARNSSPPEYAVPTQVVAVAPSPKIVSAPTTSPKPNVAIAARTTPVEVPMSEELPPAHKSGFWHHLFGSDKKSNPPNEKYLQEGVTPLPGNPPENHAVARPVDVPSPTVSISRYQYISPAKPAPGNRTAASGAFTKARLFEQDEKWVDALQWYQQAAQFDPSWFEAQYNTGVLAHRLRNYPVALPSYEYALAIQPDSTDARYNFALALKGAGYALDAAEELKKILAQDSGEVRAHLALANLYAQVLHEPALARQHYLKVLELDPSNAQASDIRFWLSENGK